MTAEAEELGWRIRMARENVSLTQPELAQRVGLKHPQSISNYERGKTEPSATRLRAIAEVTEKPLSYFLGEDGLEADQAREAEDVLERFATLVDRLDQLLADESRPPSGRKVNGGGQ